MNLYRVTWEIDIPANSIVEAARKALEIQRDRESIATVFRVDTFTPSISHMVDLGPGNECSVTEVADPWTPNNKKGKHEG